MGRDPAPDRMKVSEDRPARVLVYHIGSLGDTLMVLPALWALKAHWPQARFTLLTKRTPLKHVVVADALIQDAGIFEDVIAYPGERQGGDKLGQRLRQIGLLLKLRLRRFEAIVYLAPSERQPVQVARDAAFFKLSGIPRRLGFEGFGPLPSRSTVPLPTLPIEAEALMRRLRAGGLPLPPLDQARRDCGVNAGELGRVRDWLATQSGADGGRPWLAIGPGSNMPAKIWPLDRYAEVIAALMREFDLWPVVFGGPEDKVAGQALVERLGAGYIAAGQLSLREAAAGMRGCVLYLGNDTGTMHLAASENVPCVVPFSARDFPGKWHPMGPDHAVIRRRPDCEGCMLERCEARRMHCMLDIGVDEVLDAARAVLARRSPSSSSLPRGRAALTA